MKLFKKIITFIMIAALIVSVAAVGTISPGAAATGVGLSEWAMRAYNEGWSYVWGGDSVGAVDCSGMITSYCGGNRTSMLADAKANGRDWGYISNGIPNIHGLGLSRPNHVGVYVGNGMEVDARGSDYGVCYQAVGDRWECWFKLTAITYPTTGWQKFNGDYYYYENGEYITDTSRTIDGVTYYFGSDGVSSNSPSSTSSSGGSSGGSSSGSTSATEAPEEDNGVLKRGSTGPKVEELQARLQELGYYDGPIDGIFGEQTEAAFKLFQKQAGLYEDGIAGSDADYLFSDDAPAYTPSIVTTAARPNQTAEEEQTGESGSDTDNESEVTDPDQPDNNAEKKDDEVRYSSGDYADDIVPIQEQLIELGYLEGEADGSYGTMTESAVKEFQAANDMETTGVVDQATYDAIFSNDAVKHVPEAATEAVSPTAPKIENSVAATANSTTVERDNAALSQKSVAGITDSVQAARVSSTTNLEFIVWLGIMIVVMLITFAIIYTVEKKKARAVAHIGRRFQ